MAENRWQQVQILPFSVNVYKTLSRKSRLIAPFNSLITHFLSGIPLSMSSIDVAMMSLMQPHLQGTSLLLHFLGSVSILNN